MVSQGTTGRGLTRFRRYTWWTVAGHSGFFLVVFVGEWAVDPALPTGARVAGGLALAVTMVASAALLAHRLALTSPSGRGGRRRDGGSDRLGHAGPDARRRLARRLPVVWLVAGGAAAAFLGGVLLAFRDYRLWWCAPATMVTLVAVFLPVRWRRVLIAGTCVGASVVGGAVALASGDGIVDAMRYPVVLTVVIAWVTLGALWSWDVVDRLDDARRLAAELAVKDERLRFAADLHDIQGHHLQVIALKSELAARLAGREPVRAAAEMEEVRRLATDAIQDTRAVVQGYRRTTLDEEITNAARVMAAADIDASLTIFGHTDQVDGTGSAPLLGLVMREATTNVLRHSRARHAEVDYRVRGGCVRLMVSNDGAVVDGGGEGDADARALGGTGLRSLAERLEAAGGELTWAHDEGRFVVTASLPVSSLAAGRTPVLANEEAE